jgi:hypothetical protein
VEGFPLAYPTLFIAQYKFADWIFNGWACGKGPLRTTVAEPPTAKRVASEGSVSLAAL